MLTLACRYACRGLSHDLKQLLRLVRSTLLLSTLPSAEASCPGCPSNSMKGYCADKAASVTAYLLQSSCCNPESSSTCLQSSPAPKPSAAGSQPTTSKGNVGTHSREGRLPDKGALASPAAAHPAGARPCACRASCACACARARACACCGSRTCTAAGVRPTPSLHAMASQQHVL